MPVQPVYTYLREATVGAIVFGAHTGLKVQTLCQTHRIGDVERARIYHVHQRWRVTSQRYAAI